MPSEGYMSDDYVASLLAKDAKDSGIKYSALGLQALLPKRPTSKAPRPNTRFLKNIIRETDNHNAALRAKEAEETRARARKLREGNKVETGTVTRDERRRRSHYDGRDDKPSKRRRLDTSDDDDERRRRRHEESRSHRLERHRDDKSSRRHGRHQDSDIHASESDSKPPKRPHRHHHRSRRSRNRARSEDRPPKISGRRRSRQRTRSPSPSRCRDIARSTTHHRPKRRRSSSRQHRDVNSPSTTKPDLTTTPPQTPTRTPSPSPSPTPSDPLTSLIGPLPLSSNPLPLPRGRGRGALTSTTTIDSHFHPHYDPATDLHPNSDPDNNDWDQALEALRDRQRWKQVGADRLRQAGFGEGVVRKWEAGGRERERERESGEEGDLVWRGKGEGREWDRGKVVVGGGDGGGDGGWDVKAQWGRLGGPD